MRRSACVSPRAQRAGQVRVTVLVNGVPQRLEGDAAADDEDDAAADGEAPVFEGDFDLVSGEGGELELDSDVEDGGAALASSRLALNEPLTPPGCARRGRRVRGRQRH